MESDLIVLRKLELMAEPDKTPSPNRFLKYSGLGLQMLITLVVMAWIGLKLDDYLELRFPAFLLIFSFLGFGGLMIQLFKSINKD